VVTVLVYCTITVLVKWVIMDYNVKIMIVMESTQIRLRYALVVDRV